MLFIAIHAYLNRNTPYIEQDTDIVKNKTPNIRIVENHHPTQQDTNPFRIGGQNVLGKDINPADQEKTDTQEPSAVIYARDILLNDGKVYDGSSIAEICLKFLSYEENKGIDTGRKDNIINILKIPSGDTIYLIHDDSWFKRGKNGFAVTDRGVYVKDIGEAADFVPWEEFRKCKNIESKSCYVTSDERKILILQVATD